MTLVHSDYQHTHAAYLNFELSNVSRNRGSSSHYNTDTDGNTAILKEGENLTFTLRSVSPAEPNLVLSTAADMMKSQLHENTRYREQKKWRDYTDIPVLSLDPQLVKTLADLADTNKSFPQTVTGTILGGTDKSPEYFQLLGSGFPTTTVGSPPVYTPSTTVASSVCGSTSDLRSGSATPTPPTRLLEKGTGNVRVNYTSLRYPQDKTPVYTINSMEKAERLSARDNHTRGVQTLHELLNGRTVDLVRERPPNGKVSDRVALQVVGDEDESAKCHEYNFSISNESGVAWTKMNATGADPLTMEIEFEKRPRGLDNFSYKDPRSSFRMWT